MFHTRVTTNKYLNKIGIKDSGLCVTSICKVTTEHLFRLPNHIYEIEVDFGNFAKKNNDR